LWGLPKTWQDGAEKNDLSDTGDDRRDGQNMTGQANILKETLQRRIAYIFFGPSWKYVLSDIFL